VLEACPGIRAAAVFGVPDDKWGQTVAAALVADGDRPADAVLAAHLAKHLARHKHPRQVRFVPQLPCNAAGKLDRAALLALADELRPLPASALEADAATIRRARAS
jgi:O-succinylbenzoic acid--CoA ligase